MIADPIPAYVYGRPSANDASEATASYAVTARGVIKRTLLRATVCSGVA